MLDKRARVMRIVLLDQRDGLHGRGYCEKEDGNGISKTVPTRVVRIVCSMVERSAPTIFTWLLGRTMMASLVLERFC